MPVRVLELPALDEDSLVAVTRTLAAQGARLVVFTAPLEPGPSPQSLAAELPPGSDAARAALARLPEPGHDLAERRAETKAVVPVVLGAAGRMPQIKARFIYRGTADPFASCRASAPPQRRRAVLEANAAGAAAANLILADTDGVVRRLPLVFNWARGWCPAWRRKRCAWRTASPTSPSSATSAIP